MKDQMLKQYIHEIINKRVIPFFQEYLSELYCEDIDIVVDFHDNSNNVKIGADKNSNKIFYHINDKIDCLENIGEQLTTFSAITGERLVHDIKLPRKEIDTLFLIHEFAHKYHWNMMRNNKSYTSLQTINRKYFFPTVDCMKSIARKMKMNTPQEIIEYINTIKDKKVPNDIEEEVQFLSKSINGISMLDFAKDKLKFDNNCGIDVDETIAKSVEKIYIENADLVPKIKYAMLTFRQDWFVNHPLFETEDKESKTSKTYADEVFYRLYNNVGKNNFFIYLRDLNYLEFSKIQILDQRTQQATEEYKQFLQKPERYLELIGKDNSQGNTMLDIVEILSSKQAEKIGIDILKYKRFSIEQCNKSKFTLRQKVAQFLQKNNLFINLPFINKFVHKQLDVLPESNQEMKENNTFNNEIREKETISTNGMREDFINQLTNFGEYRNLPPAQIISYPQKVEKRENEQKEIIE